MDQIHRNNRAVFNRVMERFEEMKAQSAEQQEESIKALRYDMQRERKRSNKETESPTKEELLMLFNEVQSSDMGTRARSQTTRAQTKHMSVGDSLEHDSGPEYGRRHNQSISIIDDDEYQAAGGRSVKSCKFDAYYEGSLDLQPFRINFLEIQDDDEVYTRAAPKSGNKMKVIGIFAVMLLAAGLGGCMLTNAKVQCPSTQIIQNGACKFCEGNAAPNKEQTGCIVREAPDPFDEFMRKVELEAQAARHIWLEQELADAYSQSDEVVRAKLEQEASAAMAQAQKLGLTGAVDLFTKQQKKENQPPFSWNTYATSLEVAAQNAYKKYAGEQQ